MYRFLGIAGSLVIFLAILLSMAGYRGKRGEKYSVLNHFISELGEVGVSRGAPLFNAGLIASGLLFIPFIVRLGLTIDSFWAKLGLVAGLGTAIACALVGVFPMNKLEPHIKVAKVFFRCGLATVVLFSLGIFFQPAGRAVVPLWVNAAGIVAIAAYSSFLLVPMFQPRPEHTMDPLNPEIMPERPHFWLMPALEWLVFFSTVGWLLCIALGATV